MHIQVLPSASISYFVYEFMKIVLKVEWTETTNPLVELVGSLYNVLKMNTKYNFRLARIIAAIDVHFSERYRFFCCVHTTH